MLIKFTTLIILIFFISSCGDEKSNIKPTSIIDDPINPINTAFESISFGTNYIYYVDKKGWNDDNYSHNAFKRVDISITKSLEKIKLDIENHGFDYSDITLVIKEGVYSELESNETLPIIFPSGLTVKGDGKAIIRKGRELIQREDLYDPLTQTILAVNGGKYLQLVVIKDRTMLDSLTIQAGRAFASITLEGEDNAYIKNCTIQNSEIGIQTDDNSKIKIEDSFLNNNLIAVEQFRQSEATYISSTIENNNIGIQLFSQSKIKFIDNKIQNNQFCGLYDLGSKEPLKFYWEDIDQISSNCENGVDMASTHKRQIFTLDTPSNKELLFKNLPIVDITYPSNLENIPQSKPTIRWESHSTTSKTTVAILEKYPRVINNRIVNTADVVWYWDSTYEGAVGDLEFDRGINMNKNEAVTKLNTGKNYYIVIFEQNKQQEVIASSYINIFTIRQ